MKKVVSILIAIIMLFLLATCGQSATNGKSGDNTSSNESVQTPQKANAQVLTESAKDSNEAEKFEDHVSQHYYLSNAVLKKFVPVDTQ